MIQLQMQQLFFVSDDGQNKEKNKNYVMKVNVIKITAIYYERINDKELYALSTQPEVSLSKLRTTISQHNL